MSQHSTWDWPSLFVLIGVVLVSGLLLATCAHCNATQPQRAKACREACAPNPVYAFSDAGRCECKALIAGRVARLEAELERLGVKCSSEPAPSYGGIRIIECAALSPNKVYFVDSAGNVVREWTLPDEVSP